MKHATPPALRHLEDALEELRGRDLLRERPQPPAEPRLSFCSNDYLGLSSRTPGPGAAGGGASRLLGGERRAHVELEAAAAALAGQPAALVFSSGYAANLGTLAALAAPGDVIVSDALNHASIIDGARLSRARIEVVPHLDLAATDRVLAQHRGRRALVVTESYFSMDADSPDLRGLREVCDQHGAALVVDEAHALGVLGPEGRGLCRQAGIAPDVLVGTFGKAFGASGAFVAGCETLTAWLWNRARSFVFSTAMSPANAVAAMEGMRVAGAEPERRQRVLAAAAQLRSGLGAMGIKLLGYGPILPWVVGDAAAAVALAEALRVRGLLVSAVRPPTVPRGSARLRLTVTADHASADIERAVSAVGEVLRQAGR